MNRGDSSNGAALFCFRAQKSFKEKNMPKGFKQLTIAYENGPLCYNATGIPPKAGDILGGLALVRTVYSWPNNADHATVILSPLPR
jgi:hypothetical protein